MNRRSAGGLLFAVGTSAAAAGIGSLGSRRAPQVYPRLDRPAWAPPVGVFGPAWTALYAAIGVAAFRLWTRHGGRTVIAALDLAIAAEIVAAARHDRPAAARPAPRAPRARTTLLSTATSATWAISSTA